MENFVKVKDSDSLVRDISSGAIINNNKAEYELYLNKRKINKELRQQVQSNAEKIDELHEEISEIKTLLISLINKEK